MEGLEGFFDIIGDFNIVGGIVLFFFVVWVVVGIMIFGIFIIGFMLVLLVLLWSWLIWCCYVVLSFVLIVYDNGLVWDCIFVGIYLCFVFL